MTGSVALPDPTALDDLRSRLGPTRRPIGIRCIRIGPDALDRLVDDVAEIRRDGDVLVGLAGGQRHTMTSRKTDRLTATAYDGEARFHRDGRGRISHFVYYEFGRRLGVARKVPS